MAIDTPARLAILGAGPVGLEAALYARFLGYDVVIYERGEIAASVRAAADARLDTSFEKFCTTLGIAAIQAQDGTVVPPPMDEIVTCHQWLNRYLLPLAATDLLSDHLRLNTSVTAISREELQTEGGDGIPSFRVLSRDEAGTELAEMFDGVLDCTGSDTFNDWAAFEANFYVLGAKTCRSGAPFALTEAHDQIRKVFAILGDRETLDLYASAARLLR